MTASGLPISWAMPAESTPTVMSFSARTRACATCRRLSSVTAFFCCRRITAPTPATARAAASAVRMMRASSERSRATRASVDASQVTVQSPVGRSRRSETWTAGTGPSVTAREPRAPT